MVSVITEGVEWNSNHLEFRMWDANCNGRRSAAGGLPLARLLRIGERVRRKEQKESRTDLIRFAVERELRAPGGRGQGEVEEAPGVTDHFPQVPGTTMWEAP